MGSRGGGKSRWWEVEVVGSRGGGQTGKQRHTTVQHDTDLHAH